jgi:DUF438 domain-containing protein
MSGVKKGEGSVLPEGHPIHTLMEEHAIILDHCSMLVLTAGNLRKARGAVTVEKLMENLDYLSDHLKETEKHYLREEKVLFPHLEKHGITGPLAQMWSEHNDIFGIEKRLYALADVERPGNLTAFGHELWEVTTRLSGMLEAHFTKENTVLFPMSLKAVGPEEWANMVAECDEIGYSIFAPVNARTAPVARNRDEEES